MPPRRALSSEPRGHPAGKQRFLNHRRSYLERISYYHSLAIWQYTEIIIKIKKWPMGIETYVRSFDFIQ